MSDRKEHIMSLPLGHMAGIPSNILDQSGMRVARCDFDGQMCQDANDNAAYIIKCVNDYSQLQKQLAASQAREAKLRKCVELYANAEMWGASGFDYDRWLCDAAGYEPAQECLREEEGGDAT